MSYLPELDIRIKTLKKSVTLIIIIIICILLISRNEERH